MAKSNPTKPRIIGCTIAFGGGNWRMTSVVETPPDRGLLASASEANSTKPAETIPMLRLSNATENPIKVKTL
jgi:hypothetical protein